MNEAGYIFGGSNMPKTPQELARLRAVAQALAVRDTAAPKNIGEGLTAIGNALAYRSMMGDLSKAETAGTASAADAMSSIFPSAIPSSAPIVKPPAGPSIPPEALNPASMSEAPAPMSGGTMPPPVQVSSASDPRGFRNNNPLNIEAGNFTQSQPGFNGSDGRFAKFASMDQGLGAADQLLQSYAGKGINTVGGIVNRWAPPSDNNPTNVYASTVAKAIGVDPNTPIDMNDPAIRRQIIGAMAQFENGRPLPQIASNDPNFMPQSGGMDPRLAAMLSPDTSMQPQPMAGPTAMAFNAQPQSANPLANGVPPQAPPEGMQPFVSPQNMQTVQTKPTQLPIGQPPQAAPQAAPQGPSPTVEQLMKAAQNPWLSTGQQAIVKSLLEKKLKEQNPTPSYVPIGDNAILDKNSGKVTPVDANKKSNEIRDYETYAAQTKANGQQPMPFLDYQVKLKEAGKPVTNINQQQESEYQKATGKHFADLNNTIATGAIKARGEVATLNKIGTLLTDPSIYQGKGGDTILELKRLAKAAGIDVGDLGGAEAVRSIQNQYALELRNPAGGAGMPGAMSDKDREFLQSIPPGLERTREGNQQIGEYRKKIAQRAIDVDRLRQQYVKKNGRLDEGFYQELAAFSDANPLFQEATSAPAAAPTGGLPAGWSVKVH